MTTKAHFKLIIFILFQLKILKNFRNLDGHLSLEIGLVIDDYKVYEISL